MGANDTRHDTRFLTGFLKARKRTDALCLENRFSLLCDLHSKFIVFVLETLILIVSSINAM
jgi:hypothetical protein